MDKSKGSSEVVKDVENMSLGDNNSHLIRGVMQQRSDVVMELITFL